MKKKLASVLVLLMLFSFSIATAGAFVPPGLEKKGGLPPGIQKRFLEDEQPTEEKKDALLKDEYRTKIESIDIETRRIAIKDGTAYIYLLVSDSAKIKVDGKSSSLEAFQKNDEVVLKLDKNNTIVEIHGENLEDRVVTIKEAIVKSINNSDREVVLLHDNKEVLYSVKDEAIIEIDGVKKLLKDIKVDMKVDVRVRRMEILEIKVTNEVKKYEGRLIAKYTDTDPILVLRIDGDNKIFSVKKSLDLSTIKVGDDVIIYVEKELVTSVTKK
ncbi:hypothetical protein [Clostridium formicaceticum]|uniref:Copper amine oxidase-like N-terminal domain-containing protein n=1 Tax=Clostridium formicaceticum TaxID=1497 RepID=A0AAC9WHP7_9CLOT|nr:hypothetical protein [Clostridium formicaceticum]AOY74915.1 hypothetical protein BJL90_02440 [Clostridium formicaceticum]ARE89322.1 hypothetical protein CLFO_37290 [Clostridium formicaceticum]